MRLAVEALDVEVAVVALLAGALDGDPQRADRGAAVGLEQLRVLGQMAGAGPAVHRVLLRPLRAGRVADQAATGATTRTERTRRAAVRPSPSEASGLRSVPRAPTLQPQAATRTAGETRRPHAPPDRLPALASPELDRADGQPAQCTRLIAGELVPGAPGSGLDGQVPGRSGRLHASLPLRRRASGIWPPHARHTPPPTADAAAVASLAAAGRPARRASGTGTREQRGVDRDDAPAGRARRPVRCAQERPSDRVDASEVAHHDRTHADPDDYETPRHPRLPIRSCPQLPRPRLASLPPP